MSAERASAKEAVIAVGAASLAPSLCTLLERIAMQTGGVARPIDADILRPSLSSKETSMAPPPAFFASRTNLFGGSAKWTLGREHRNTVGHRITVGAGGVPLSRLSLGQNNWAGQDSVSTRRGSKVQ